MPNISVILPVHNTEKYIKEAIESILSQTYKDFELIIINDASTDGTPEVIRSFPDPRIIIIDNEVNLRVVKSLNKGFDLASGKFIARMDADDICYPERFEKQMAFFEEHPDIEVCATWAQGFGDKVHPYLPHENHEDLKAALLFSNVIVHPTVMFRKESLDNLNVRYDEWFTNAEDYGLWVEIIDRLKFGVIPEILLKYRIHNDNISVHKKHNLEILREMNFEVYKRFLSRMGVSYNQELLKLHFRLGFKLIKSLTKPQLKEYLNWLKLLATANKKSMYFKKDSLQNEVIRQVIFLYKKSTRSPAAHLAIVKALVSIYSISDYISFLPYRRKKRLLFKKRISEMKHAYLVEDDKNYFNDVPEKFVL